MGLLSQRIEVEGNWGPFQDKVVRQPGPAKNSWLPERQSWTGPKNAQLVVQDEVKREDQVEQILVDLDLRAVIWRRT
jgi:hypothetical protein